MSLTLSTLPAIQPAYSANLIMNASDSGATADWSYKFEIYVDSVLRDTFTYSADPDTYDATIDLSPLISPFLESSVYVQTGATQYEFVPDSVRNYRVRCTSYDSGNTQQNVELSDVLYFFNGCANQDEDFEMKDYMLRILTYNDRNFLTDWATERTIMIDDYAYISAINGIYDTGDLKGYVGAVTVHTYIDGVSASTMGTSYLDTTTKGIVNIDVSPATINSISANTITDEVDYYVVNVPFTALATPMRINIVKEPKVEEKYNFLYINRRGGVDFFTAYKPSEDEYRIEKKELDQYVRNKSYYTQAAKTTVVRTQYLTKYEADNLKDLFYSPAIIMWDGSVMHDIQIINSRVVVRNKYPRVGQLQYEIEFKYNNKNFVQQF